MDHLQTFKDWLRFVRNGAIATIVVILLFFWNSPHSAQEIAVVIALPLIIFNAFPILITGLVDIFQRFVPKTQQQSFPFTPTPVEKPTFTRKQRIIGWFIIGTLIVMVVSFCAGISILIASSCYHSLNVAWAIIPARYVSYTLIGISILPIVAIVFLYIGLRYSAWFRDNGSFPSASALIKRPINHWPTSA
ncbi:MAG: hypothetical protein Q7S58_03155 [Candidatus Binatus sp.]|uniref:hypothetical protein n=1 Tax=Candidatus Binatus sp. TaxID=2811406 RepID=UPI002722CDB6|nr:hypothetical protein [Candidatus Binatus sp.]MDO8431387.1 hypothetical protein [Candidatus Binatus sp.]